MTTASEGFRSERRPSPCSPSPSASATITAAPSQSSGSAKARIFALPPPPARAHSHKAHRKPAWQDDGVAPSSESDNDTQHNSRPCRAKPSRVTRRTSERAMTMPLSRTPKKAELFRPISPTTARRAALRRSPSPVASSSSSSPDRVVPPNSTAGIGRKVAASLDLFKESAPSPSKEKDESDAFDLPRPDSSTGKRRAVAPVTEVSEPQFEFVKRSDWPDREAAAIRREKSSTGLDRIRTRDSTSSVTSSRDQDFRRRKERTLSRRETVLSDLVQWRAAVEAGRADQDGRGRPRERNVYIQEPPLELDTISPESQSSTISSASTFHHRTESRAPVSPPLQRFPPSPQSPRALTHDLPPPLSAQRTLSPLDLHEFPPPARRAPIRSRSPQALAEPSFPLSGVPQYPHPFESPWSTDEEDDESAWETASATTTTSTTSASSPFPLSPSRTSPRPQPRVHNASDEDEERHQRAMLSPYDELELTPAEPNTSSTDLVTDFEISGYSHESLPHIPLRPFRNQVGGHSAIYKFTKRAVCKPLVSRENLFYEAVEREAPPLLEFIPRYLGVMLVSYRRVPKSSSVSPQIPSATKPMGIAPDSASPRPILVKSASDHPRSTPFRAVQEEGDTDVEEAELPEVALDYNRHIIPHWLLHGHRNRSMSHSSAPSSLHPGDPRLRRHHYNGMTASSPDLATTTLHSNHCGTSQRHPSSRLAFSRTAEDIDNPTPMNSPRLPVPQILSPQGSLSPGSQFQTGWFGGTGSTVVNTRFKDHVFSTLLRRLSRHPFGKGAAAMKADDDGEVADGEGDRSAFSDGANKCHRKTKLSRVERLRQEEGSVLGVPLRRVQSEREIGSRSQYPTHPSERARDAAAESLFEFESQGDVSPALPVSSTVRDGQSFAARSYGRSRSRSLPRDVSQPPISCESRLPTELRGPDPYVTRQNHFILMEDLTGRLKSSCVLDLKMGTRQYGMDATLAKKKSQRKKCDRTTSRTLGVWNHVTQAYVVQDKYKGREVRPDDFPTVLASFLHDGERLLVYQIPVILHKIYALARIVNRLKGYRFYGCSLLMIYDGDREAQEAFRASVLDHPSSRSKRGESLERQLDARSPTENKPRQALRRSHSEDLLVGPVADRVSRRRKRGEVQIRLVDFAHTTTGRDWLPYSPTTPGGVVEEVSSGTGYQAEVDPETGLIYGRFPPHYPDQPDRGFLFGLMNLAETLEKIWNEERLRRIKSSREDPASVKNQLPPLSTDGKEIFDEIFRTPDGEEDLGYIST
ncbi:hypothetical protein GSI_00535 [Ganoderma sinense ZZ0214-1]|uniref:Kinase n=1 Tax=Ganoderma sinense ZZ0214-1 TaxID=1077348 RepID=A0A2G8SSU1_9APHY|nr:hypothetical protein GSI_00535 [Ganoderma sinense ZZ0214-1]